MPKRAVLFMAVLVVVAFAVFLLWTALAQQELSAYNPRSFDAYGFKGIHSLMVQAGFQFKITRSIEDDDLPGLDELLVITTKPGFPKVYRRKILNWVKDGGTVLELSNSMPVFSFASDKLDSRNVDPQRRVCYPAEKSGLNLKYHLGGDLIYTALRADQGLVLKDRRFISYVDHHGIGRIIHWNDPDGLTNMYIHKFPDNAVLFTLLMKEYVESRRIVFCYRPIFKTKADLANGNQYERYWLGGFLLLVGVCLLLWKLAVRFGRPRPLQLAKGRSADEFVYSMADLFQQADLKAIVLDNLYQRLLQAICRLSGLSPLADWETVNDFLALRLGKEYAQKAGAAVGLYRKYQQNRKITKQEFIELAGLLDRYRKELTQWKM
jgi:hypothetical protein